jgi:hypothetical protein
MENNYQISSSAMQLCTIDDLKAAGFKGFVTIGELRERGWSMIPKQMGVYVVARTSESAPKFLNVGSGGHFKGKDPNVSIVELLNNWVNGTCVVYIGKAGGKTSGATLQKRLGQYLRFGQGVRIEHWGGRYIWQLEDAPELVVCWKPLAEEEPAAVESQMISGFKAQHGGKRPFANLKD